MAESIDWLAIQPGKTFIDATVGLGGHSQAILERSAPDGRLLAIDADPQALTRARQRLAEHGRRAVFAQGRHNDLTNLAQTHGFSSVDGILFDLGVSSLQIDDAERGFSFQAAGPLDMRMGPDGNLTAADIVNFWDESDISRIIYEYGEERYARRIARAICASRPFTDTTELAEVVARVVGRKQRIHPATRTFQALRIAVNAELDSLSSVLPQAISLLKPGGRLVVISFHSLEDRIVKRYLRQESRDCICPPRLPKCVCGHKATVCILTKKPIGPSQDEIDANPRSRSARLRVAERLPIDS